MAKEICTRCVEQGKSSAPVATGMHFGTIFSGTPGRAVIAIRQDESVVLDMRALVPFTGEPQRTIQTATLGRVDG